MRRLEEMQTGEVDRVSLCAVVHGWETVEKVAWEAAQSGLERLLAGGEDSCL